MIYVEIPQKQAVELLYDEHTGTYPILYFSEDGIRVLKLQLHPDMAVRIGHLLDDVRAKQQQGTGEKQP